MAACLIRQYKPNFLAVHLACTDHYEHQDGRESYMVRASVAGADRNIKTMLEAINRAGLKDSTLVIITGDHGFENIYRNFNPNYLLKEAGLITDVTSGDWKAQFHSSGGGTFLELKDANDKATLEKVKRLLAAQPDSIKQYFALLDKAKLDKVGTDPNILLALTGLKGTSFGSGVKQLVETFPKVRGTHGFYPDHKEIKTGFVAYGPGLNKGVIIPNMQLQDITPLIVQLTRISFPKTEGKVYKETIH